MDDGRTVGRDSILRRRGGRRGCGNNGDVIFRADRGFPPNDSEDRCDEIQAVMGSHCYCIFAAHVGF